MSNWHSAVSATAGGKPLQFSCGLVRSLGRTFLTSSGFARSIARIFLFLKCILVEGFRGSIPLWCRAGWGWRWDQRLPGLASPHIKPDSIFWQSTQLHSWVTFTTPEKPRPTSSLGITVRGGLLDAACGGWLAGSGRACGREPPRRVEGRIQGGGEAPPHLRKGGAKPLPNLSRAVSWLAVASGTAAN